jgi:transforming growth factor-beta-induced protein
LVVYLINEINKFLKIIFITLNKGGPFTIFAPTNDAFNALPEGALAKLLDNPQELKKVLLGHVSSGNYPVALIRTGDLSSLDEGSHHIVVTTNGI